MASSSQSLYEHDLERTRENRSRLQRNRNLMFWYQQLYQELFATIPNISQKRALEIGSGTSPLKMFLPTVITSDVLQLEYLDIVFDCHCIAEFEGIPDHSIDVLTLTNVLHHLRDPIGFLRKATRKLAQGGEVYIVEPYFSLVSSPFFKLLHHEPVDFTITRPLLGRVDGPLSSSNQAIPHMIFFSRPDWLRELEDCYVLEETKFGFFTSLAYMLTGGISRTFPIPTWMYRPYFVLDSMLARSLPKVFASFFSVRLVARK